MEPGFFREWIGLIALIISMGGTLYAWLTSKSKINADHLRLVEDRIADHTGRIGRLESEVSHLPPKDDIVEVKLALAEQRGALGRLDESLGGISRTVRRMEDFLMKDK